MTTHPESPDGVETAKRGKPSCDLRKRASTKRSSPVVLARRRSGSAACCRWWCTFDRSPTSSVLHCRGCRSPRSVCWRWGVRHRRRAGRARRRRTCTSFPGPHFAADGSGTHMAVEHTGPLRVRVFGERQQQPDRGFRRYADRVLPAGMLRQGRIAVSVEEAELHAGW